ncbi:uncharacterized protein LOC133913650 [Phragmites australis]|uniref:uncharacterized protein LOC133913650 n=1 Tax=Phragmites australis TaxID=29695 RepID=UPI002D7A14C4|nr:uncharacterized protein LOC133913650 [Phragmites australis]
MGGPSAGGRRVWARRSCRTGGGGGGVVRRTVAVPESAIGASTAWRRKEGFAHVDKQRRVHGVLLDFRCCTGSTRQEDNLLWDVVGEFKHKSSHRSSIRCLPDAQRNVTEISHMQSSVIVEINGCDAPSGVLADSQKISIPWTRENKISTNNDLCHASSTDSGLPIRPKYHLFNSSNNVKNPPAVKSCSNMNRFSYQLVKRAERSASTKMGSTSPNCSLSEKMSLLHQPRNGGNHQNQNRISALNRRHKIVNPREAINLLSIERVHDQPDSSLGRHSQAMFDNALVRQNQLCCSEQLNQKTPEQLWSSVSSECEKAVCFSSGDSVDDLQVSSSSDTSDNSNLSSLGFANDQWKMTFKKIYCPLAARLDSAPVIYHKEIGQPSPVSVLEPPSEDCSNSENIKRESADPYDFQLGLELVKFPPMETAAEFSSTGGTCDHLSSEMESSNDEPIQLVDDILEEFEDEEERDFSYLLDILIASGIHGTAEDQLYRVCQSLDHPAGYDVFEKLEKKYAKVVRWSKSDRKLLFDIVNTILSQILAPCLDMQPWVNIARNLAPIWGSEGLLEKVLQVLGQRREELALCKPKPEKKSFDQKWPDLADCIDRAGRDIEKMIKDDLLEELFLELLFS